MTIIAKLSVMLKDTEPEGKRRLEVLFDIRLNRLHQILQAAFGWTDSRIRENTVRGVGWGIPAPHRGDGPLDGGEATLFDVIEDTRGQDAHRSL